MRLDMAKHLNYEETELSRFMKAFRETNGVSQRKLADMLNLHYGSITAIEIGRQPGLSIDTAKAFSKYLSPQQRKHLYTILTRDIKKALGVPDAD